MQNRNYEDEEEAAAWKRIVEKMGNPVPDWNDDRHRGQTQEQLLRYANSCLRYLNEAMEKKEDPTRNADGYWNMATLWWEMRIEAIKTKASRAPTVPMPLLKRRYHAEEPKKEPAYKKLLRESLDGKPLPCNVMKNSPIRAMTSPGNGSKILRAGEVESQDVKDYWFREPFQDLTSSQPPLSSPTPSKNPLEDGLKKEATSPQQPCSAPASPSDETFTFNVEGF